MKKIFMIVRGSQVPQVGYANLFRFPGFLRSSGTSQKRKPSLFPDDILYVTLAAR